MQKIHLLIILHGLCAYFCFCPIVSAQHFEPFQDPQEGEFGLVDLSTSPYTTCLQMKFHARLYNFNFNATPIVTELEDFTSQQVRLHGFCALANEVKRSALLQASWTLDKRKRVLNFKFSEGHMPLGRRHEQQEVRWLLSEVTYSEEYKGRAVTFSSLSPPYGTHVNAQPTYAAPPPLISAPMNQKFVCRNRLNITLHNPAYRRVIVELLPKIDIQPVNSDPHFGSNTYMCERTRKQTLAESFQNRMTIFSGVVLGIASVSLLAGYSLRRQIHKLPELGFNSAQMQQPQQQPFYNSF